MEMKEKEYADVLNSDIQSAEGSLCGKDSVCRECESFSYPLMEQFLSLQGEGFNTGKAAYFIRLAGCNVRCDFCDVKQSWNVADRPLASVGSIVDNARKHNAVNAVVTGGEPLLYDLNPMTRALKAEGICTWLETSASKPLSGMWDWICISPKTKRPPLEENMIYADELKVVISDESDFSFAELYASKTKRDCMLYLQAEWESEKKVMKSIIDYIEHHPIWRLSLQTHKYLDIR